MVPPDEQWAVLDPLVEAGRPRPHDALRPLQRAGEAIVYEF